MHSLNGESGHTRIPNARSGNSSVLYHGVIASTHSGRFGSGAKSWKLLLSRGPSDNRRGGGRMFPLNHRGRGGYLISGTFNVRLGAGPRSRLEGVWCVRCTRPTRDGRRRRVSRSGGEGRRGEDVRLGAQICKLSWLLVYIVCLVVSV